MMAKLLRMFTTYRADRTHADRRARYAQIEQKEAELSALSEKAKRSAYAMRLSLSNDALGIIQSERGQR